METPDLQATAAELPSLGVVRIEGADATTFLQAHFCNDVAALAENDTQLSGYCSPKGRLLSIFHLHRLPAPPNSERLLLLAPREVLGAMVDRLAMFAKMARPVGKQMMAQVTRTDVSLTDCSESLSVVGVSADVAGQITGQSEASGAWPELASVRLAGHADESPRYYLVGTAASLDTAVPEGTRQITESDWQLLDIRAGLPSVVAATRDRFVPQMVNLQLIDGLSFTKGCYPGQEIVARMQYLGSLKRRMERGVASTSAVEPGTDVLDADGNSVGEIVLSANTDAGCEMLVVMRISALDAAVMLPDGTPVQFGSLPYAFDEVADTAS